MSTIQDVTICHLNTEDGHQITTKIKWYKSHFEITIVNANTALTGVMNEYNIVKICKQLGIQVNDYMEKCRNALSVNGGCNNFIYTLIDNSVFQWKKVEDLIKISFGSVQLTAAPIAGTLYDTLDVAVISNNQQKEKVLQLKKDQLLLEEDNRDLMQRISECIQIKINLESELYSHFSILLNAKKSRIVSLERLLKSNNIKVTDNELEESNQGLYEVDTEVESDSDSNTDDERNSHEDAKIEDQLNRNESLSSTKFDSESEEMCVIPKRKATSSMAAVKDTKQEENNKNVDLCEPGCSKQFSNKRNNCNDYRDDQFAPSKLKVVSAVETKKLKLKDEEQKDVIVDEDNSRNEHSVKQDILPKIKSSVDDILAGLLD